ncbi:MULTISPECIES: hypothetical protein [Pseudofrankia]|uniref:hypothetical protein n=1 Tax=Pseudofrankia TaxID=2994363 RepID=UPI000234D804|nr:MULTISPECIES: hypothetical protein [Pseudofrankia]
MSAPSTPPDNEPRGAVGEPTPTDEPDPLERDAGAVWDWRSVVTTDELSRPTR